MLHKQNYIKKTKEEQLGQKKSMLLLEGLLAEVLTQCCVEKKEAPSQWHLTWSSEQ